MNDLDTAASPYLLQHAGNPVHWRQWTPETLAEAKRSGKPILLSVGYAACHWCHVMAHESFEDEATAEVMNALFVNIKVDREERPDVDQIYMAALHAFGQRGGWPLTMFLTPDAEPFWGGTYFPNRPRHGQPAFVTVLRSVEAAFRAKPEQVAGNTKAILAHLDTAAAATVPLVSLDEMDALAVRVAERIDPVHGGMAGAPKFPNPSILEFLWRASQRGVPRCADLVILTLERMSQGGIFDHLGGGFARYSTDERWLAPHFEKMLYDNAQLLPLLALASRASGDPLFAARAAETVDWLANEMTEADGVFRASLDADSEGVEGKFYVWTREEVEAVLAPGELALFVATYDVTAGGNWAEEPHGPAVTILNRLDTPKPSAEDEARLPAIRRKLSDHRATRPRPGLDDKILADWNGLMIAGLVDAGTQLDRPAWIDMAARAYAAVMETMAAWEGGHLRLAHARRLEARVKPAFALDHAAMARAAVGLAEATGATATRDYLSEAGDLLDAMVALHRDPASGLLCMAAADAGDLPLRLKPTSDDAIPNAHAVALDAMLRLSRLGEETRWLDEADRLFEGLSGEVQTNVLAHLGILNALDLRQRGASVVVAGSERAALRTVALRTAYLTRSVVDLDHADGLPADHPARAQIAVAGSGAAFVCRGSTCSPPIRDAAALAEALGA